MSVFNNRNNKFLSRYQTELLLVAIVLVLFLIAGVLYSWYILLQLKISDNNINKQPPHEEELFDQSNNEAGRITLEREQVLLEAIARDVQPEPVTFEERSDLKTNINSTNKVPMSEEKKNILLDAI